MPLSRYFGGHGAEVMRAMQSEHGQERGREVFYRTANKLKAKRSLKGRLAERIAQRRAG